MGTWDSGPFDNDTAADFAFTFDESAPEDREGLVRATLSRAARARGEIEASNGEEAVAAAALVASQCPGGEPVTSSFGPDKVLPVFPPELRAIAVDALDRILAEESELAELWDESGDGPRWRRGVTRLRAVLAPVPPPQPDVLLDR
ncbi:DUF4259 domain-containing protein [Kitasatospora cinereorecta]|uniref:DUF4259 domain-containing protein n=1 Tax=Kitasatospora cinereorecta TaxID=285560 RepID=A0ABW0VN24_9ACTN